MRGKAGKLQPFDPSLRITPAYAGKSGLRSKIVRNDGDHPRLCGEKTFASGVVASFAGSPPPMRGKVQLFRQVPP